MFLIILINCFFMIANVQRTTYYVTVALLRIAHLLGTPCQQLSQHRLKQRRGRGLHCLENHRFQTLHQQSCLGDRERGHKIIGILIPYGSSMVLGILGIIINSMSIDFFHLGMLC